MSRPELYYSVANLVNDHIEIPDISRMIANYWFDYELAARWIVKHQPIYMVIPIRCTHPAYISMCDKNNKVYVRIDHASDFTWAGDETKFLANYAELYTLQETYDTSLAGWVTYQLGPGSEYAGKLFRFIREDIDTVIRGDVYVPPKIPIPWPPTIEDLMKQF